MTSTSRNFYTPVDTTDSDQFYPTSSLFGFTNGDGDATGLLKRATSRAHYASSASTYVLAQLSGIDLKTAANHQCVVAPSGKYVVIRSVVVRCTAADTVTVPATISVGVTGDDIYESRSVYGLTSANKHFVFSSREGGSHIVSGGESVYVRVDVGATATSQTASIDILGYTYG